MACQAGVEEDLEGNGEGREAWEAVCSGPGVLRVGWPAWL
jgi:hypothetical protein